MKKFIKTIAKAYAIYLALQFVSFGVMYIYGCRKYGRDLMNWGVRFSLSAYKAWFQTRLMRLGLAKPTKLDTSGMLDWSEI